jgi:hypothetical protein
MIRYEKSEIKDFQIINGFLGKNLVYQTWIYLDSKTIECYVWSETNTSKTNPIANFKTRY